MQLCTVMPSSPISFRTQSARSNIQTVLYGSIVDELHYCLGAIEFEWCVHLTKFHSVKTRNGKLPEHFVGCFFFLSLLSLNKFISKCPTVQLANGGGDNCLVCPVRSHTIAFREQHINNLMHTNPKRVACNVYNYHSFSFAVASILCAKNVAVHGIKS